MLCLSDNISRLSVWHVIFNFIHLRTFVLESIDIGTGGVKGVVAPFPPQSVWINDVMPKKHVQHRLATQSQVHTHIWKDRQGLWLDCYIIFDNCGIRKIYV